MALDRAARPLRGSFATALTQWVFSGLDATIARSTHSGYRVIYCYEDCALKTMLAAKRSHVKTVYELPSGYFKGVEEIISRELSAKPELGPFFVPFPEPRYKQKRKQLELETADVIICPSRFSRSTTEGHCCPDRIQVIPYGADITRSAKQWPRCRDAPVRLLYVGQISPRKGIHLLFEALARIASAEYSLTLIGTWRPGFRQWLDRQYGIRYRYLGKISHIELHNFYKAHDALVFPTLADGFGLVILEAMACGIPVIASTHSAGPDIITNGRDGLIFRGQDVGALRTAIADLLNKVDILPEMGFEARRTAEQLSWDVYGEKVLQTIWN